MANVENEQESYSNTVNNNAILLSFEGWIKYIEGFIRGLGTTRQVDAAPVLDCVGEVLEYMQTLRKNLMKLLQHCEITLVRVEELENENEQLKIQIEQLKQKKLEDKRTEGNNG